MTSSFNSELDKSLQLLYNYASNFPISVELIQRLAQQLKLETFIDSLGFLLQDSPASSNVQKLTIAASSILLDVDFESDTKIVNLSLSINGSDNLQEGNPYTLHKDELGLTHVKLNSNNNPVTFLNKAPSSNKTQVEEILLSNLQGPKLGNFPINLQYLATIDKFANYNPELFIYIETIAFLLHTVSQIEKHESEDWKPELGLLGNVKLNEDGRLGVVLEFWKDYELRLNVVDSSSSQIDYLIDNQLLEWDIADSKYRFEFENTLKPLVVEGDSFAAWEIQLELNKPVYVPVYMLEYIGLFNYCTQEQDPILKDVFEKINNGEEFEQDLNIDSDSVSFRFVNNIPTQFVSVKSVNIVKLIDAPKIISILRNFIVLSNLISGVINNKLSQIPVFNNKRRRSTRMMSISTTEKELTEDAKQKLKESLKLPHDVTDEEILGLSAISESANYSTIQPVNNKDIDLDKFLNTSNSDNIRFNEGESYLVLRVENIFNGELKVIIESQEVVKEIHISNGEIRHV